ncbi:transcriptional regulator [Thermoleophilia bacterium SCSIO 60948]|nr:transcriptional regulator [Thermoleophilia bacterium SCSIO 60948]
MSKSKRSYGDVCGTARALDTVGERWSLMVVRELLCGPKRFTDLRTGLPHVSPDVLSQRLRDLEGSGIVQKRTLPPPTPAKVYELTDHGRELGPVIAALGRWGARLPLPDDGDLWMSFDAHVLSFQTMFDPASAEGADVEIELRFTEGRTFVASVANGELTLSEGEAPDADAVIEGPVSQVLAAAQGRLDFDEAIAGAVEVSGDESAARRFCTLFPLPDPAPVPA